jgi:hypothetical protein
VTGKELLEAVANGKVDVVELLLGLLRSADAPYAVIGGLAVNAYAEPVVSLDLHLVVVADRLDRVVEAARRVGMRAESFAHSINLSIVGSDLRIQLQTDPRYQDFIERAETRTVLGYEMSVAALEDVVRGKVWAYSDVTRRRSKRHKDLADLLRLAETRPEVRRLLPAKVTAELD